MVEPVDAAGGDPDAADIDRLAQLCVGDSAFDVADVAELVRLALRLGASPEDVANVRDVGVLILDRRLRSPGARTAGEVVAECGLDWEGDEPYLRASGLPVDPGGRVTDGEAEAIRLIVGSARELLGEEATLQLARMTGSTTARLAESVVDIFRLRVEVPRRAAGVPTVDIVEEYSALALALLPRYTDALDAVLRRQILSVASSMWSTDEERSAVTVQRTVGFVDLVGYTEATASMTVRELTQVLLEFEHTTADMVSRQGGSVVKSIGDEILFWTESADAACRIALDLLGVSGLHIPEVRVGMASGEMVAVLGDLYGPDVNLAARLVGAADPSTAVVSERVRDEAEGFEFAPLAPFELKGVAAPVTAFRLVRTGWSSGA
jgi:adenylate cyclase